MKGAGVRARPTRLDEAGSVLAQRQLDLLGSSSRAAAFADDIRISPSLRARRLTLKVIPPFQLELVVPRGTSPRAVEAFLRDSRQWIARTRAELEARYPPSRRELPREIVFPAFRQRWHVEIDVRPGAEARLASHGSELELTVARRDSDVGYELLRRWLLKQGARAAQASAARRG